MTEALRTSKKNGNREPLEAGGGQTLQNVRETWEGKESQDSTGETLDEMSYSMRGNSLSYGVLKKFVNHDYRLKDTTNS